MDAERKEDVIDIEPLMSLGGEIRIVVNCSEWITVTWWPCGNHWRPGVYRPCIDTSDKIKGFDAKRYAEKLRKIWDQESREGKNAKFLRVHNLSANATLHCPRATDEKRLLEKAQL